VKVDVLIKYSPVGLSCSLSKPLNVFVSPFIIVVATALIQVDLKL